MVGGRAVLIMDPVYDDQSGRSEVLALLPGHLRQLGDQAVYVVGQLEHVGQVRGTHKTAEDRAGDNGNALFN